jgi:hypothetical protein
MVHNDPEYSYCHYTVCVLQIQLLQWLNVASIKRKKTGGEGAAFGTFHYGEGAACVTAGAAYTAGVEEEDTVYRGAIGDMGMAEERRFRPSAEGGVGNDSLTITYPQTVSV